MVSHACSLPLRERALRRTISGDAKAFGNLRAAGRAGQSARAGGLTVGVILDRVSVFRTYLHEMVRHGLPEFVRSGDRDIIMFLDGVGGFQFIPLLARKVIREANAPISSTWFRWQVPIPGLMLVDFMWRSRNQRSAQMLADRIVDLHCE